VKTRGPASSLLAVALACVAQASPARAVSPATEAAVFRQVGFDQQLDAQVPLDGVFRDSEGRPVRLGDCLRGKPVILTLVYYECPMLCTLVLNGLVAALKDVPFDVGREFDIVTLSFNPAETHVLAAGKKETYLRAYGRADAAAGWHFLVGEESAIRPVADAAGFRHVWDPETRQYAHAAGIMVLTPEGRISKYFYGLEYRPRDVRLGLVEASRGRIGSSSSATTTTHRRAGTARP
jgi:protein SCO1/2